MILEQVWSTQYFVFSKRILKIIKRWKVVWSSLTANPLRSESAATHESIFILSSNLLPMSWSSIGSHGWNGVWKTQKIRYFSYIYHLFLSLPVSGPVYFRDITIIRCSNWGYFNKSQFSVQIVTKGIRTLDSSSIQTVHDRWMAKFHYPIRGIQDCWT